MRRSTASRQPACKRSRYASRDDSGPDFVFELSPDTTIRGLKYVSRAYVSVSRHHGRFGKSPKRFAKNETWFKYGQRASVSNSLIRSWRARKQTSSTSAGATRES